MNGQPPPVSPPPELPDSSAPQGSDRLASEPSHPPFQNPFAAAVLSLLTGLGHVYLGAYERAIVFVLSLVAMFLIGVPFLGLFVYFFAIIDAYRQAQLLNLGQAPETPPSPPLRSGGYGFGLFLVLIGAVLLAHNVFDLDLRWLRDWWPAALVLVGLWLVIGAWLDRRRRSSPSSDIEP
jgi:hypothetical protein